MHSQHPRSLHVAEIAEPALFPGEANLLTPSSSGARQTFEQLVENRGAVSTQRLCLNSYQPLASYQTKTIPIQPVTLATTSASKLATNSEPTSISTSTASFSATCSFKASFTTSFTCGQQRKKESCREAGGRLAYSLSKLWYEKPLPIQLREHERPIRRGGNLALIRVFK